MINIKTENRRYVLVFRLCQEGIVFSFEAKRCCFFCHSKFLISFADYCNDCNDCIFLTTQFIDWQFRICDVHVSVIFPFQPPIISPLFPSSTFKTLSKYQSDWKFHSLILIQILFQLLQNNIVIASWDYFDFEFIPFIGLDQLY